MAAMRKGYRMFAVQNGGWCAASATAHKTFDKYGKSTACKSDRKGGPWANQVYVIRGKSPIHLAVVVKKVESAIPCINPYKLDKYKQSLLSYSVDSDLLNGKCHLLFGQLWPVLYLNEQSWAIYIIFPQMSLSR